MTPSPNATPNALAPHRSEDAQNGAIPNGAVQNGTVQNGTVQNGNAV